MNVPINLSAVPSDPLPWLTDRFRERGADVEGDELTPEHLSAMLGLASSIVSALSPSGETYSVRLVPEEETAATSFQSRTIAIGGLPVRKGLTLGVRAAVIVGLCLHEVGHIEFSEPVAEMVTQWGKEPKVGPWKMFLANIVHDLYLDPVQQARYGGFADTLDVVMALLTDPDRAVVLGDPIANINALMSVAVFPNGNPIPEEAQEFAEWALDWGRRCTNDDVLTPQGLTDMVMEALEHIIDPDQPEPEPEPEPEPDEGEEEEDGEGEGDDAEGDESESEDGSGGDGESEDEGEGQGSGTGSGKPEGESEGESEGQGQGEGGQPDVQRGPTKPEEKPTQGRPGGIGAGTSDLPDLPKETTDRLHPYKRPEHALDTLQRAIDIWSNSLKVGRDTVIVPAAGGFVQRGILIERL